MPYFLWRGERLLGEIVPFGEGSPPTPSAGHGRLLATELPPDLTGSMQMRHVLPTGPVVMQFPSELVDFDAIRSSGASSSAEGRTPGRSLNAIAAQPMRDEFILTVRDESGRVLAPDLIKLDLVRWPEAFPRPAGESREQWMVVWSA